MILPGLAEAADRNELLLVEGGLCRFHRRRDGVTVIREVLVLPHLRERGIGRAMVAEVLRRAARGTVEARCPVGYRAANAFWPAVGFLLAGAEGGLNLWRHPG